MSPSQETLLVSNVQLVYLAGLLGVNQLIGTPDPFRGWLTEEIRPALEAARGALADRGLISLGPDGAVDVEGETAALVQACGRPVLSVILTIAPTGAETSVHYFHLTPTLVVEQVSGARSGASTLTRIANPGVVAQRAAQVLHLDAQPAPPGSMVSLPAARFHEIRSQAMRTSADPGAAVTGAMAALLSAGLSAASASALAMTLAQPIASSTLVTGSAESGGMGILHGANGFWCFQTHHHRGQDWADLTPCGGVEADAAVTETLDQAIAAAGLQSSGTGPNGSLASLPLRNWRNVL